MVCGRPNIVKGVKITPENSTELYQPGKTITLTCQDGFSMIGNNKLKCLPNLKWSRNFAKCISKYCLN